MIFKIIYKFCEIIRKGLNKIFLVPGLKTLLVHVEMIFELHMIVILSLHVMYTLEIIVRAITILLITNSRFNNNTFKLLKANLKRMENKDLCLVNKVIYV